MADSNMDMFGVSDIEEWARGVEEAPMYNRDLRFLTIMSMMSDAQGQIHFERLEDARKTLNRAKFLVDRWFSPKES